MYLLNVTYTSALEDVQKHTATHSEWVKKYVENETFLFAGPKRSKFGGAILVKTMDKSCLMKILSEDSFVKHDVAEYQIIDFDCKLASKELQFLIS